MEMEEIDLGELFSYFVQRIYIIIIAVLVCLICGITYTVFLKEPLYKSDVNVIVVSKEKETSSALQSEIIANQKLAATYRELVESRRILKEVIKNLELKYSVRELQEMISVENVNETEIIRITVNSKSAMEAKMIANETAEIFEKEIVDIYNLENVSIIDKAELASSPYNVNLIKDSVIYFALGLVLSCGIIFVIYYFDNTIKSVEQIEKHLGIPVIGTVPSVGKKGY